MIDNKLILELEIAINKMAGLWLAKGYSYTVTEEATDSFLSLVEDSKSKHINISSIGCDTSIYSPIVNLQFRFWHDCTHCLLNSDFSLEGETKVINYHLQELKMLGLSSGALALFHADTIGQVRYYYKHKQFVKDQYAFIAKYLINGSLELQTC